MNRITSGTALVLVLLWAGFAPAAEPEPRLLVPAYFYPAGEGLKHWDQLIAVSARVPVVAIVNPASGPGDKADTNYTRLLDRARRQPGLTLLGYVSKPTHPSRSLDATAGRGRSLSQSRGPTPFSPPPAHLANP